MRLRERIGIERALRGLASFQYKYYKSIIVISLIVTLIFSFGLTELEFEGDISKFVPQELPAYVLEHKITSKFKGEELMVIAVCLNDDTGQKNIVRDIRDPRVIQSVVELHERLEDEPNIDRVQSIAPLFQAGVPDDVEGVKAVISAYPSAYNFFNRDYSIMLVYASPISGMSEEQVKEATGIMQNNVDVITKPGGVTYKITGNAPLIIEVLRLLREDMIYTTTIAAILIFGLLVVLERSFKKGVLVFIPLLFALIWTFGSMGYLDIPLSISTVMVGAIILGLGVEYGIFMVSRYYEEREKDGQQKSLEIAVSNIGLSTFGSAATTSAAFFTLSLSVMPTMQQLGQALALSIIFCWIAATMVNPCFILFEELVVEKKGVNGKNDE